ncbi:MAG TPA: hypothetical protein VMO26_29790, partial [Vicinamibacterales bacterium]|nr:hypothetical protein [Vicinamibacterales bacterium]
DGVTGPGVLWPAVGAALVAAAWMLTLVASRQNKADRSIAFFVSLLLAVVAAVFGAAALAAGPWLTGLEPTRHAYDAIVWLLIVWCGLHILTGIIMQAYCLARRAAGRMTARYDIDIANTALFWHFVVFTVVVTVVVIAGFPQVRHG